MKRCEGWVFAPGQQQLIMEALKAYEPMLEHEYELTKKSMFKRQALEDDLRETRILIEHFEEVLK